MTRLPCSLFLALTLLAALLPGCGDDKETVTNAIGFDEELILGTDPASWTAVQIRTIEPESGCFWHETQSTDLLLVLQDDAFRFHGTASPCGSQLDGCMPQELYAVLQSAERIDFTRYREARLRCTIRYGGNGVNGGLRRSIGGSGPAEVTLHIHSNVPGTPGLSSVVRQFCTNDTTVVPIDISLENALAFREATVELILDAGATCARWIDDSYHPGTGYVEVTGFGIVGWPK